MFSALKYCLLWCLCIFALPKGYAGAIDSLSSKDDVQEFLIAQFGSRGVIFLTQCAGIYSEKRKILLYRKFDTLSVEDPVSGKTIRKAVERDTSNNVYVSINDTRLRHHIVELSMEMDNYNPYHFYKTDIDHNGHTDLVVDAGIVIVVLDTGGGFEGHIFSNSADKDSYSFKQFMPLPDGSFALLLRHDHNPCNATVKDMPLYYRVDTLVYKFGAFAKYKSHLKPVGISKVVYCQRQSYGMDGDGVMCMQIYKGGQCFLFHPDLNPGQFEVSFSATSDSTRSNELWNFMSYISGTLKDGNYRCEIDHAMAYTLAIYFDDGTVKKMHYWDYRPPMDVAYLCKSISDISRTLKWQPSERRKDIEWPLKLSEAKNNDHNECNCQW